MSMVPSVVYFLHLSTDSEDVFLIVFLVHLDFLLRCPLIWIHFASMIYYVGKAIQNISNVSGLLWEKSLRESAVV